MILTSFGFVPFDGLTAEEIQFFQKAEPRLAALFGSFNRGMGKCTGQSGSPRTINIDSPSGSRLFSMEAHQFAVSSVDELLALVESKLWQDLAQ